MAKTIEELYEIINDLRATVDKISKENEELKASNAQKDAEIKDLKKKLYGTGKSEKIDPRQEELFDKDEVELRIPEQKDILVKVSSEYFRKAGKPKRLTKEEKYGHLPTLEEIEYIPEEVKNNPQRYEVIGEETTFEICPTQRQYLKRVHKRIRFREKESHKKAPLLAPAPKQLVQGSICSVEWLSQIIIDKYLDHLPLDRQCKIAERSGIKVTVKNMYDWLGKAADAFEGVYDEILKKLKSENYLQADETPIDYLEGKKPPDPEKVKGSKIGYFWLINAPNDYVLYHWATSRAAKVITDLLGKNWKGLLQCDGYSSYKSYGNKNTNLRLGACLVHIRRKFITAGQRQLNLPN